MYLNFDSFHKKYRKKQKTTKITEFDPEIKVDKIVTICYTGKVKICMPWIWCAMGQKDAPDQEEFYVTKF